MALTHTFLTQVHAHNSETRNILRSVPSMFGIWLRSALQRATFYLRTLRRRSEATSPLKIQNIILSTRYSRTATPYRQHIYSRAKSIPPYAAILIFHECIARIDALCTCWLYLHSNKPLDEYCASIMFKYLSDCPSKFTNNKITALAICLVKSIQLLITGLHHHHHQTLLSDFFGRLIFEISPFLAELSYEYGYTRYFCSFAPCSSSINMNGLWMI